MMLQISIRYIYLAVLFVTAMGCKKTTEPIVETLETQQDTLPKIKINNSTFETLDAAYVAEKNKQISLFYDTYWLKNKVSGGILVAKNGEIIFEKYEGYSNFSAKEVLDSNTPIHIASVSKLLTATAIMLLVETQKISLDQKVSTVLTAFPYPEISIRTLLNHRSGLRNYAYYFDDRANWNPATQVTNQAILDEFAKHNVPLDFQTDKKFAYCNTNYAILALIIEKITGLNYREAMKRMIFEPLSMNNTFVIDYEKDYKKYSQSYKGNYVLHPLNHLETVYGDKNIYSTPRDLLKFHQAISSKNYVTPELQAQIFKGYSYERRGTKNYGLGIRMMEWQDGKQLFYHNGWWHGNTSSYVNLRDENVVIIALANKYTTMTYKSIYLAALFGDYPFELKKDELGF